MPTTAPSGVIRSAKDKNNPWKTMNTAIFQDERLSWEARGILGYLLSQADNWQVRFNDLLKKSPDCGRFQLRRILKELEQFGYLVRVRTKDSATGRFEWESVVYETPQVNGPSVENRPMDKPHKKAKRSIVQKSTDGTIGQLPIDGKLTDISNKESNKHEDHDSVARKTRRRATSDHPHKEDKVFDVLAEVCKIDTTICTNTQRLQLNQTCGILRRAAEKAGASDNDLVTRIRQTTDYYYQSDWRGQKGQFPTPAIIREIWVQARESANGTNGTGKPRLTAAEESDRKMQEATLARCEKPGAHLEGRSTDHAANAQKARDLRDVYVNSKTNTSKP